MMEHQAQEEIAEWGPERYDRAIDLVSLPLLESTWLGLYATVLAAIARGRPSPFVVSSILDVGCGTGRLARLLHACGWGAGSYIGLDYSPVRIQMAREYNPELSFLCADVFSAEGRAMFKHGYDLFLFIEILEHVTRDLDLLGFVPPGKKIILTVPNYAGPGSGHMRKFEGLNEVVEQYGGLMLLDECIIYDLTREKRFFLLSGVRR